MLAMKMQSIIDELKQDSSAKDFGAKYKAIGVDPQVRHSGGYVKKLIVLKDNKTIASIDYNGIKLWDSITGECLRTIACEKEYPSQLAALDNNRLLTSHTCVMKIWDTASGTCVAELKGHNESIQKVLLLPNGLIISYAAKEVRIWEQDTAKCVQVFNDEKAANMFPLSNNLLACLNDEHRHAKEPYILISIWDPQTGKRLLHVKNTKASSIEFIGSSNHLLWCQYQCGSRYYYLGAIDINHLIENAAKEFEFQSQISASDKGGYWQQLTANLYLGRTTRTEETQNRNSYGRYEYIYHYTMRLFDLSRGELYTFPSPVCDPRDAIMLSSDILAYSQYDSAAKSSTIDIIDIKTGIKINYLLGNSNKISRILALSSGNLVTADEWGITIWEVPLQASLVQQKMLALQQDELEKNNSLMSQILELCQKQQETILVLQEDNRALKASVSDLAISNNELKLSVKLLTEELNNTLLGLQKDLKELPKHMPSLSYAAMPNRETYSEDRTNQIISIQALARGFFVKKENMALKYKIEEAAETTIYPKLYINKQRRKAGELESALEENKLSIALKIIKETDITTYNNLLGIEHRQQDNEPVMPGL